MGGGMSDVRRARAPEALSRLKIQHFSHQSLKSVQFYHI